MHIFQKVVRAFPLKVKSGKFVPCVLYKAFIGTGFMCYVESTGFKSHWYKFPYDAVCEALAVLRS